MLKTHVRSRSSSAGRKLSRPACSDIDLSRWRDYDQIETGTLWLFESRDRGNGHQLDYHGGFIPQVANQLIIRYTKTDDIVLDMFVGSGTTAIEAINTGRRCIGIDIKPELIEYVDSKIAGSPRVMLITGDSTEESTVEAVQNALNDMGCEHAHLLILHPPYWDIIQFSDNSSDLSNAESLDDFLSSFRKAAENGYHLLQPGRFAGLVIGDKYSDGELVPLGFYCMQVMKDAGFKLKSIVVKNIEGNERGKGRNTNLWRYRALAGGFYIFKHEYVMIFQKPDG